MVDVALVHQWEQRKAELKDAQAAEKAARQAVIAAHFNGLQEGSNVVEDDAVKVTVNQPMRYTVDASLPREWRDNRVFRVKVELNKSEYNRLSPEQRRQVDKYLTVKPGSPSLTVDNKGGDS